MGLFAAFFFATVGSISPCFPCSETLKIACKCFSMNNCRFGGGGGER